MRNATIQDVEEAQRTGALKEDVMYGYSDIKVHGKRVDVYLSSFIKRATGCIDRVVAETAKGTITDVRLDHIKPLSKGSAFTPRKPRPKPIKGTRPERKIPVAADTEIKVGDVVLFNKERAIVTGKTGQGTYLLRMKPYVYYVAHKKELTHLVLPYEEKEVTYQIGDRFDHYAYGPQLLARIDTNKVALIGLLDGNRFTDPVEVKRVFYITQQEFDMISHGAKFTKQSDSVK